ncbi:hypothetical protein SDC9_212118 [bioreactor metagenome]|uniref:Uncharacterized protein n=1 Tax=bioreactor metagenome TaxID=1076179 RepID=A0A645JLQ5_9ZZZZ
MSGVHFAIVQFGQFLQCHLCCRVGYRANRQCYKGLFHIKAGILPVQDIFLQVGNRVDNIFGQENHVVG